MIRVGLGYDIHRLESGRPLVLGGITISHPSGLAGHSDADVLLHALMDALLGAAALGDIGRHFPPGDDRFRAADSRALLRTVNTLIGNAGYDIVNVDLVLVAEAPRIGPHIDAMRTAISTCLRIDPSAVSIKATTNEGLGPEGRGEAMSAHAVALLSTRP
jgi:2-C-methyl-D-erythritol 2,4-cyclodiphosphate synthase